MSPDGYKCYKHFIACLTTAHEHKARHFFLKDCLAEHVLPRSIPKGDNVFGLPFPDQQRLALQDRILMHGMETGNVFAAVRRSRVAYQNHFPAAQFSSLYGIACRTADARVQRTKGELNKKLQSLMRGSRWSEITNPAKVLNLSGHHVNENVLRVLSLGLNFALKPSPSNVLKAVAKMHLATTKQPQSAENEQLRGAIWTSAIKLLKSSNPLPRRYTAAIDYIKKQTSLAIMPSDKSGQAVILNWADYIRSGELVLSDASTYKPRNRGNSPLAYMIDSYSKSLTKIIESLPATDKNIKTLKDALGRTISP